MAKIIDTKTGKPVSESMVIRSYFGTKPGQTTAGFMAELKALSPEDKSELALGAAQALGYQLS